jgi:hypothetical protein
MRSQLEVLLNEDISKEKKHGRESSVTDTNTP